MSLRRLLAQIPLHPATVALIEKHALSPLPTTTINTLNATREPHTLATNLHYPTTSSTPNATRPAHAALASLQQLVLAHATARTSPQRHKATEQLIYAAHFQWPYTPPPHLRPFATPEGHAALLAHWPVDHDLDYAATTQRTPPAMRQAWLRNDPAAVALTLEHMRRGTPHAEPAPAEALRLFEPILQHFAFLLRNPALLRHRRSKTFRLLPLALPLTPRGTELPACRAANLLRARVAAVHRFLGAENPALAAAAAACLTEEIAADPALPRHMRRRYAAACKHGYVVRAAEGPEGPEGAEGTVRFEPLQWPR